MKLIGLTGSIATGKSTVSQMCRDAGVQIHDADRAVHKLLGPYGAAVSDVLFHFGDIGSIEQSFSLSNDDITQPMLDNGITLNSNVQVQNGEGGVGSWAPNRGSADTFTIRLQIQDGS